jgi:large subunit ribosomal protein L23
MRLYTILQRQIVTEKTANMQIGQPRYAFEVSQDATKIDVKMAIKELYGIEVADVNIINVRSKFKFGKKKNLQARRRETKKAYVTLKNVQDTLDVTLVK